MLAGAAIIQRLNWGIGSQAHMYGSLWASEGPLPSLFTRSLAELSSWRAAGLRTSGSYRLLGAGIISLPCGPLHRAVWHGSWLRSEQASQKVKKVSDQKPQSFCNLISEMTSCQFYYVLLSRGKLLDPAHTQEKRMSQRHKSQKVGPPLGFSGWESACQCRGHRFDPWSRKIPHAMEQLSPCATTTEPVL